MLRVLSEKGHSIHFFVASSGNAALAAAYSAKILDVKCTVYVTDGAGVALLEYLRGQGAEVKVFGRHYSQTLHEAERVVQSNPLGVLVPSYDDPLLWEGHSSMIREVFEEIQKPEAIFCSVGGGGLLGGIIEGCAKVGWDDVRIFALETHGSACFYHSMSLNSDSWVTDQSRLPAGIFSKFDEEHKVHLACIENLSSMASSLGANSPSAAVVKMALERSGEVKTISIPDEMSMHVAVRFAEEHKFLVELACATALAPGYIEPLFSRALSHHGVQNKRPIVFIVDGGFKVTLKELEEYQLLSETAMRDGAQWDVYCNGERWHIPK